MQRQTRVLEFPGWMTDHNAEKLPNGNFVVNHEPALGKHPDAHFIKVIDPATDQVITTFTDAGPGKGRQMTSFANGNIALCCYSYGGEAHNINVYNPETKSLVCSIPMESAAGKIFGNQNDLIITPLGLDLKAKSMNIEIYDSQTGKKKAAIPFVNMQIDCIKRLGNQLVILGLVENSREGSRVIEHKGYIVNDNLAVVAEFNCTKRGNYLYADRLSNGNLVISEQESLFIIDPFADKCLAKIEIPRFTHHNLIFAVAVLGNGNFIAADNEGNINEFTPDGTHVQITRTNLRYITSSDVLRHIYDFISSKPQFREARQAVTQDIIFNKRIQASHAGIFSRVWVSAELVFSSEVLEMLSEDSVNCTIGKKW